MTGTVQDAPPAQAPPEHVVRRRVLVTLGAVLLVVGLLAGGPWVYARLFAPDAPPPLALPEQAQPEAVTVAPGPLDLEGTWRLDETSEAGYRLQEVLSGQPVTVVGRTAQVSGSFTVDGGVLTAAEVVVDVAAMTTDESARDAYFRRALDTSTYPQAVLRLTAPVDVTALAEAEEGVPLEVPAVLVLHGVERPVTASLVAQRAGGTVEVAGTVPVVLADHGLTPPELGFVTVEPQGTVEVLLRLTR
ncbi:YceI family protein [Actinotalea sp. Marseille-Q4924]|uniref:YceI family protein n=1 Tax=Actinotalea sp. Marseille-Q4924 TaxID=2866571 RepID=UPI001CE3CDB9|nr:YceI family protein [Actinotalea sp. Marseille-Q4924]